MALSSISRTAVASRTGARAPAPCTSVRMVRCAPVQAAEDSPKATVLSKGTLVDVVAEKTGLTKKQATQAIETIVSTIAEAVTGDARVTIQGFGTFEARHRAARAGRNPITGAALQIPAAKVPAFRAGKAFKDQVNGVALAPKKAEAETVQPPKPAVPKAPAAPKAAPAAKAAPKKASA